MPSRPGNVSLSPQPMERWKERSTPQNRPLTSKHAPWHTNKHKKIIRDRCTVRDGRGNVRHSHLPPRGFWDGKSRGQKKRIQEVQFSSSRQHYLGPFRSSVEIKTSRSLPFLFSSKTFSDSGFCPAWSVNASLLCVSCEVSMAASRAPTSPQLCPLLPPPS